MKTIIAGSRSITKESLVFSILDKLKDTISEVVSGGARGIDSIGEIWAADNNIKIKRFLPNWNRHKKAAGHIRNKEMADYVAPDGQLILIWDGKSHGSKSMKDIAIKMNLQIKEYIV